VFQTSGSVCRKPEAPTGAGGAAIGASLRGMRIVFIRVLAGVSIYGCIRAYVRVCVCVCGREGCGVGRYFVIPAGGCKLLPRSTSWEVQGSLCWLAKSVRRERFKARLQRTNMQKGRTGSAGLEWRRGLAGLAR
jgi:hypothetical protein